VTNPLEMALPDTLRCTVCPAVSLNVNLPFWSANMVHSTTDGPRGVIVAVTGVGVAAVGLAVTVVDGVCVAVAAAVAAAVAVAVCVTATLVGELVAVPGEIACTNTSPAEQQVTTLSLQTAQPHFIDTNSACGASRTTQAPRYAR
jgi:hypothetical protein